MSFSQLRKVPSLILSRMSSWSGRNDDVDSTAPAENVGDKDGGRCTNVDVVASGSGDGGGGGVGNWRKQRRRNRNCSESSSNRDQFEFEEPDPMHDEPILSEQEHRDLRNLLNKNISMDFILEMREAFQLFDKNGDGFISAKELGVLMRTLGRNPTEDEILNIMNEIDVDHNGKLDFSEFTVMMKDKLTQEDLELEIKQAFRVFDRNGDGFISKAEFKHCMMHFGEQFTDEEVEEMISEADSNDDGRIDYNEFSQMILKEIRMESEAKGHLVVLDRTTKQDDAAVTTAVATSN